MIATPPTTSPARRSLAERSLLDAADERRLEALFGFLATALRLQLIRALVRAGELPLGRSQQASR
ncbi:MAG TPA: hypothetical protein VF494_07680 [Candidatus Limnocylindrales bacterium]